MSDFGRSAGAARLNTSRTGGPDLYQRAYVDGRHLHTGLTDYFHFYNHARKHQSLAYQTPAAWYKGGIEGKEKVQFSGLPTQV